MSINEIKKGMLAKSKAGHDKEHIYVICDVDETHVYLVDGNIRTLSNPKKKKIKHVQVICDLQDMSGVDDVKIKRRLKLFDKENRRI